MSIPWIRTRIAAGIGLFMFLLILAFLAKHRWQSVICAGLAVVIAVGIAIDVLELRYKG